VSIWLDLKIEKEFEFEIQTKTHLDFIQATMLQQVLTCLADKFIASARIGVGHHKIRRKTLGLHDWKARAGHMIQEEVAAKVEVATQIEAMVGVECKIGSSTTCSMKEAPTIG
jgi:hypothetical protein